METFCGFGDGLEMINIQDWLACSHPLSCMTRTGQRGCLGVELALG